MKNIFPKSFTEFDLVIFVLFAFYFYQRFNYVFLIIWLLYFVFIYRLSFSFEEEKINKFINFTNFKGYKIPQKFIKTTYVIAYFFIVSYLVLTFKGEINKFIALLFPISLSFVVSCKKCILAIKLIFEKGLIKAFFLNEKFYSSIVLDTDKNEKAEQQQKRPVTEEAFYKILKSYYMQLWNGDIRKVLYPATMQTLLNIGADTDPNAFHPDDFDDFIEEQVKATYENCTSSIEGLTTYIKEKILDETDEERARYWMIGDTYELDGEIGSCDYEDMESFLDEVNFNQVIKILQKCWDRACKTEEVFPEDEAMNDRRNGFIAWE